MSRISSFHSYTTQWRSVMNPCHFPSTLRLNYYKTITCKCSYAAVFGGIKTIGLYLDQLTAHKLIELMCFSVIRSLRQPVIIEILSSGCDVVNWKWSAVVVVVGMMSICWSSTTARVWIKALLSVSRRAPLRSSSQWRLKRRGSLRECSMIWSRKTGLIACPFP